MDALYHNPKLVDIYDAVNASREDFDFYLQKMPAAPAAVLDIGCGTGTFALELAHRGYAVTALDPAPQMIARAMEKDTDHSVDWRTGLTSDLADDLAFDVALMTGHAFQCLLEDAQIVSLFEAVETRLKPGGSFWFETRNPAAKAWVRWTPENARPPIPLDTGRTVQVVHNVLRISDGYVTFEERYDVSDTGSTPPSQSTLRFPDLHEIENLASPCGLCLSDTFGDWTGAPFGSDSPEIIVRLQKAASRTFDTHGTI